LLEEITFEWSKESGHTNTQRIRGPKASIRALYPGIVARASRVILRETSSKPWSEIEATYGGQDDSGNNPPTGEDGETVVWELLSSDDQKPITDSAVFQSLSDSDQNKLLGALADLKDGNLDVWPIFTDTVAAEALLRVATHADSFLSDSWVLRKTQVVDNQSQLNVVMAGINNLWTSSQIAAAESTLYAGIYSAMTGLAAPTARDGYIWSWLKRLPSITGRANNKIEITQDWIQAQWANVLYPVYVP